MAVWIGLALRIARWPALAHVLETWAPRGVPFLLIAIGVYVLLDTATDVD